MLDIGGVVYRSWPDDAFHQRWGKVLGLAPELVQERLWGGPHWPLAELGKITAETCFAEVGLRLGVSAETARSIAREAFASDPDDVLARYVEGVRRRGVVVAALTNNLAREPELLARPELARLFDLAISSADTGLAKPDLAAYRNAETRLGSAGADIVFVDDVQALVDAAASIGWRAIRFTSTPQVIEAVEAWLATANRT